MFINVKPPSGFCQLCTYICDNDTAFLNNHLVDSHRPLASLATATNCVHTGVFQTRTHYLYILVRTLKINYMYY